MRCSSCPMCIRCPCVGVHCARYNTDPLAVHYKGKTIADGSTCPRGSRRFVSAIPAIHRTCHPGRVGWAIRRLGTRPDLSGGEAQRVSRSEGKRRSTGRTIYVRSTSPPPGLHFGRQSASALRACGRLVAAGNTVIVIEHTSTWIKTATGSSTSAPTANPAGGDVIVRRHPEHIAQVDYSYKPGPLPQKIPERISAFAAAPSGAFPVRHVAMRRSAASPAISPYRPSGLDMHQTSSTIAIYELIYGPSMGRLRLRMNWEMTRHACPVQACQRHALQNIVTMEETLSLPRVSTFPAIPSSRWPPAYQPHRGSAARHNRSSPIEQILPAATPLRQAKISPTSRHAKMRIPLVRVPSNNAEGLLVG